MVRPHPPQRRAVAVSGCVIKWRLRKDAPGPLYLMHTKSDTPGTLFTWTTSQKRALRMKHGAAQMYAALLRGLYRENGWRYVVVTLTASPAAAPSAVGPKP